MNWSSCSARTTLGSIDSISPTWPTSCSLLGSLRSTMRSFLRADQAAVAAGEADRLAAGDVDQADDVLLHLAGEHPLDDLHRLVVGDAHALDELALLADLGERLLDLRPAAVDDDRVHADQLQQHDVLGEVLLQRRVGHRVAAVLDDDRLAVELAGCRAAPGPGSRPCRAARRATGRGRVAAERQREARRSWARSVEAWRMRPES